MRPNKLTIQAFGPFSATEVVDFDRLGTNPLFLINGPTGAGKSSILDAICFALYGQTTGKERDATQMRCDHAPADLLTEITLDFSLGDQTYRIRRSPQQERPKARGDGTTLHPTEAQLWQLAATGDTLLVPKKANEATEAIKTLTGLDAEQFRQVMVLPQGKFRDFLMADSNQREAIFSKLFQTNIYKRIEDALKEKASGIKKDIDRLHHQISGILQGADLDAEPQVQAELDGLAPQLQSALTQKNQTREALTEAEKAVEAAKLLIKARQDTEQTQKNLQTLESQQPDIEQKKQTLARGEAAQKIQHLRHALDKLGQSKAIADKEIGNTEQALNKQTIDLATAKAALTNAESALLPADQLKQQSAELHRLIPKVTQLSEAYALQQRADVDYKLAQTRFNQTNTTLASIIELIKTSQARSAVIKHDIAPLAEQQQHLDNLRLLGEQSAKLDKTRLNIDELVSERATRQVNVDQSSHAVSEQDKSVKTLEFHWHNSQAAILATELQQGAPCPVCGSLNHPVLATQQAQTNTVSKQMITEAKQRLLELQKTHSQVENKLTQTTTQLASLEQQAEQQQQELGDHKHKSTEALREQWSELNKEVKNRLQLQAELATLDKTLQQQSTLRESSEKALESDRSVQQKAEQTLLSATQTANHIEQELPSEYRQQDALTKAIEQIDNQIKTLIEHHHKADQHFNSTTQAVTQTAATLQQQKTHRDQIDNEFTNAINNWQNTINESVFKNNEDFLSALINEQDQARITEELQGYTEQLSRCRATLEQQQKQLSGQHAPDLDQLSSEKTRLNTADTEAINQWKQIDNRVQQLERVKVKLEEAHQSNSALEAEYAVYGTLSNVANGQTGNKVSLQRFVLSVLLDDVLIEASHRLTVMSKGRYLLVRNEERAKGNRASGLELQVEDAYTGKARSVATLSGGESFMAALSLALGLSDVVQAYAGGIKLDTLFIDEGFGSLDQESLDLAIKTLIDLQSSGRMIGIISHVSELREQMALRVDVNSTAQGSTVSICAG